MASVDERQVFEDLLDFLSSPRADVRVAAIDAVLSTSGNEDVTKLIQHNVVAPLVRSCSHPDPVGCKALQALLYLSSGICESQCVEDMLDAGAVGRLTEIALSSSGDSSAGTSLLQSWKKRVNFCVALLANMTRTERGAVELVGRTLPEEAVKEFADGDKLPTKPALELLLSRFLNAKYVDGDDGDTNSSDLERDIRHEDPFQHFAAVLMNSTQTEAGRRFLLKLQHRDDGSSSCLLQVLLPSLTSKNPIRRRGIAGTVKNCCLETDFAWWLLNELKIVKHILYPLSGPEELNVDEKRGLDPDLWLEGPDKQREVDPLTRLYLIESLLLLCATGRKSRETIRLAKTYVILKLADMVEEQEQVSERINECVQYLRRDEQGMPEGSSDELVEKAFLPLSSSSAETVEKLDYDDVD